MFRYDCHLVKNFCFFTLILIGPFWGFSQTNRPNIIFILTDDQRWDALGFAGNPIIKTPEMDALAKSGTYFKNAFSTTPICAASRASILTGLYERTHGYTFQKPKLQGPYAEMMYPKILKDNGYHIGFFGKLGVNIDNPEQYFDQSDFYDRGTKPDKGGYFYKTINKDTVHLTRYSGFQAQDFIINAPKDKPFCLSVFFSAPHAHDSAKEQYFWQAKSDDLYKDALIPSPVLSDEKYFNQLPLEVKNGFNRTRWKWRFDTPDKYQNSIKGYYRMISEIDDEIGMLRKLLKERGLADNTIIIVMGDNGYFTGDRQLADKWLMYDASIRIPLIIYDPRKRNPASIDAMVLNIDVSKSILEFAGLKAPRNYQGMSLNPFLFKGNSYHSARKSILIEHLWKLPEIPSSEGVRTARWKFFRYRLIKAPEELYDLRNDPLETINLAGDIRYSKVINQLKKQLNTRSEKYSSEKLVPDEQEVAEMKF
ncbi:sulfatase [Daejeonella sp.]|uniref:sulfatase family protein n=1 Tax=Daejeonella sp. TaxID=2805397 RepID=UPI00272EEAC4|nr:sulfatase [Daejeonella sp.]MDP2414997.1 sulfatase [Daejeonella sp.]